MKNLVILVAAIVLFAVGCNDRPQPSLVNVEEGLVQGTSDSGLTVFKGIPFAKPPVGDLRWRAPQPSSKWDTVLQADKFAPGLMQDGNPVQQSDHRKSAEIA